jgi:hypothetical protein
MAGALTLSNPALEEGRKERTIHGKTVSRAGGHYEILWSQFYGCHLCRPSQMYILGPSLQLDNIPKLIWKRSG